MQRRTLVLSSEFSDFPCLWPQCAIFWVLMVFLGRWYFFGQLESWSLNVDNKMHSKVLTYFLYFPWPFDPYILSNCGRLSRRSSKLIKVTLFQWFDLEVLWCSLLSSWYNKKLEWSPWRWIRSGTNVFQFWLRIMLQIS